MLFLRSGSTCAYPTVAHSDSDAAAAQKLCRVLLVGEGNFSFSASVCETAGSCTEITATCFQPEEAARQQGEAGRNIQRLLERGKHCISCAGLESATHTHRP